MVTRWLRSRKYRKYRIVFMLILLILFGDIIPYRLVPPVDPPPNGVHMNTVPILAVRPTAYQPAVYATRILMFGNSSLHAFYLPPEETIASYLQLHYHDTLVINLGAPSSNVNGQLLKLMDTPLSKGDTVIFYDGPMEAIIADADRPICSIPVGIVALICAHIPGTVDADRAKSLVNDVKRALQSARAFTESRGATFIHIFQPVCLRDGNPFDDAYRQMVDLLSVVDSRTINMAHFLGCYNDYFYDFIHTRPNANQLIADKIYEAITPVF